MFRFASDNLGLALHVDRRHSRLSAARVLPVCVANTGPFVRVRDDLLERLVGASEPEVFRRGPGVERLRIPYYKQYRLTSSYVEVRRNAGLHGEIPKIAKHSRLTWKLRNTG